MATPVTLDSSSPRLPSRSSSHTDSSSHNLKKFVKTLKALPKLIVLDIDYTVWPLHVDCSYPPFRPDGKGGAVDGYGEKIALFRGIRTILKELRELGFSIAAASRTEDPPASRELLGVLKIDKLFDQLEIFPARKFSHFKNISETSGVDYKDMLFFDDEYGNIRDISTLGVTCFYIEDGNGLTVSRLKKGLEQFSQKNSV